MVASALGLGQIKSRTISTSRAETGDSANAADATPLRIAILRRAALQRPTRPNHSTESPAASTASAAPAAANSADTSVCFFSRT
jgi:hypothetical protein